MNEVGVGARKLLRCGGEDQAIRKFENGTFSRNSPALQHGELKGRTCSSTALCHHSLILAARTANCNAHRRLFGVLTMLRHI